MLAAILALWSHVWIWRQTNDPTLFAQDAAPSSKVVFTPKWSNETTLQLTNARMPRTRDTPKRKEKKKGKKKSSGVTYHYNTKTNKNTVGNY